MHVWIGSFFWLLNRLNGCRLVEFSPVLCPSIPSSGCDAAQFSHIVVNFVFDGRFENSCFLIFVHLLLLLLRERISSDFALLSCQSQSWEWHALGRKE